MRKMQTQHNPRREGRCRQPQLPPAALFTLPPDHRAVSTVVQVSTDKSKFGNLSGFRSNLKSELTGTVQAHSLNQSLVNIKHTSNKLAWYGGRTVHIPSNSRPTTRCRHQAIPHRGHCGSAVVSRNRAVPRSPAAVAPWCALPASQPPAEANRVPD